MKYVHNRLVMKIVHVFLFRFKNNLGDPCGCTKVMQFGGFDYHGNLVAFFGFYFLVFGMSRVKFCT